MPLILGVDSSTQSTKVEVRDADTGALVAVGRAPHPPTTPPRSEQDPHTWWDALHAALDQTGVATNDIAAVAVAGQQHGLVVVDASDRVIRPAKLWNDTESAPDTGWLIKQLTSQAVTGEAAWAAACGSVPVAAFTIAKLSWLHRSEPEAWARVARVCLPHDWLTWKLSGEFVTDRGDASGTGYFSAATNEYRLDLLAIVDDSADWAPRLPRVLGPTERAGTTGAFGSETVVAAGTGDNMAAALALGLQPGDVAISLGTSGTVYTVSESPTADPTGAVAGFADATGRFLPLVCTLNATKVTETVARWLGVDHAAVDALALAAPAGANGLVVVPYFDGERTPNRPDASGTIAGARTATTREDLARAAIEGVVCGLLDGLDALTDAGVRADGDILLVGGGARSAAYRQVLADLSGRPVVVPDAGEHVHGQDTCAQAAAVLHGRDIAEAARDWALARGVTVEPNANVDRAAIRAAYTEAGGYRRVVTDVEFTPGEPMDFADSILDLVGNTPLVRLRRLSDAEHLKCTFLAKVETVNPGGSVKDRVAIAMVDAAERDGLLKPGGTIVEPTSGNTGAGLAIVAAQRGYHCIFVMSDKMSDEKVALLRSYGAEVVVCPTAVPPEDPRSYYSTAERLVRETPGAFRPDQYSNAANPLAHEQTTGPEIWKQTHGRVTHFVAGVGTGGTITGVGRALKARNPGVQIIGADPSGSVYSGGTGRPYLTEGVGEDFWPTTFDRSVVDRVVEVSDADSFLMARRVTQDEGLLIGGSGGTAVCAALEIACPLDADAVVVVLLPDSGRSYLTKIFDDQWMFDMGFLRGEGLVAGDVLAAKGPGLPDLVLVLPEEQVRDAIAVMHETGVSQVVVSVTKELPLAAKEVVGTLRELELMDLTFRDDGVLDRPIADVMSPPMPMIGIGEPVARVVACLEQGPSVLVLEGGHPIGVLTRSDVLSFLAVRTKT